MKTSKILSIATLLMVAAITLMSFADVKAPATEQSYETIIIKVTNRNTTSGDTPAISTSFNGSNSITVQLNSSQIFEVKANSPYLYLWTCDGPCLWKRLEVPVKLGGKIDNEMDDPFNRKLTFERIK